MSELCKLNNLDDLQRVAKIFISSGFFKETQDLAQACVKIMAGAELGFSPIVSMSGIYIVKGKPALSAGLMASKISTSGYRHEVRVLTEQACELAFFQGDRELGISTFSMADAEKAGLLSDTWRKFPRNLLFARAMSNGCRWFCPGAFGGQTPYTPEELGETVDGEGMPKLTLAKLPEPAPELAPEPEPELAPEPEPELAEPRTTYVYQMDGNFVGEKVLVQAATYARKAGCKDVVMHDDTVLVVKSNVELPKLARFQSR